MGRTKSEAMERRTGGLQALWQGGLWVGVGAGVVGGGLGAAHPVRAQGSWYGDLSQWNVVGDTATLAADGAGETAVWHCISSNESMGWDASVRWVQALAGSLNNQSALHVFTLAPGLGAEEVVLPAPGVPGSGSYGGGIFLRLGATGSEDPLEVFSASAAGDPPVLFGSWEPGTWASGLDRSFRFRWGPETPDAIHWYHRAPGSTGAWAAHPPLPWTAGPVCMGLSARYTSSNTSAFQWVREAQGPWLADTTGPRLLDWQWLGDTLQFTWDEPIHPDDNPWVVWWDGSTSPAEGTSTQRAGGILWALPPAPPPGVWLDVGWPALQDTLGLLGTDTTLTVSWLPPGRAGWRDLVITEIMADPTPSQGFPEWEWVEVLNRGEEGLDLQHVLWWDTGSGLAALEPLPGVDARLFPGERAVLSGSNHSIPGCTKQLRVIGGLSLLDAGDEVGLRHPDGTAIDQVAYERSWWQGVDGGISCAVRTPGGCDGPSNWSPSRPSSDPEAESASPELPAAFESPLSPDPPPPLQLLGFVPESPTVGWFVFDEPLNPRGTPERQGGLAGWVDATGAAWGRVRFQPEEVWEGIGFHVELRGVERCAPPGVDSQATLFAWADSVGHFPVPGDLRLTEIAAVPIALGAEWGEYVEWANASGVTLETGGVRVQGEVGTEVGRRVLVPGAREVREVEGGLPNAQGDVVVTGVTGDTLERVRYGACWHGDARSEDAGLSWVRWSLDAPAEEAANWVSSGDARGGSPGGVDPAEGEGSGPGRVVPRLEQAGRLGDRAVVLANVPLHRVPGSWKAVEPPTEFRVAGWGNGRLWEVPAAPWQPGDSIGDAQGQTAQAAPPPGWLQVVDALLGTEPAGNEGEPGAGGWLWNEMLGDPVDGGEPFVELAYRGSQTGGWVGNLRWTTEDIPMPEDWHAFGSIDWWVEAHQPVAWARCPSRLKGGGRVLPATLPSLHGDRQVTLGQLPWLFPADTVRVANDRHSPWIWDPEGISLERVEGAAGLPGWQWNGWFSCWAGQTPGLKNAQHPGNGLAGENLLALSSQTVTPGPGGRFPHVEIQLCPPAGSGPGTAAGSGPGTAAAWRLALYDGAGRMRHTLLETDQAPPAPGACARWIWDGRGPSGTYLAPGTYLLLATDPRGRPHGWSPVSVAPVVRPP